MQPVYANTVVRKTFENAQGEVPLTCSSQLKKKKGLFCKGKPLIDGLCMKHIKPCEQDDDENTQIGGKIQLKETMKKLRRISKEEGVRGIQ